MTTTDQEVSLQTSGLKRQARRSHQNVLCGVVGKPKAAGISATQV